MPHVLELYKNIKALISVQFYSKPFQMGE